MLLKTAVKHTCPVVLNKAQVVVIVQHPFCFRLNFGHLNFTSLFNDLRVVKPGKEADLDEYSSEKGKVMIVTKADHVSQYVLLAFPAFVLN